MTDSCFQERDCPADQRATSHTRFNFFLIDYTHHLAPEWKYNTATVLKRSGVNIAIISESLGHSDLETTQIYLDSFENSQIDEAMKNLI